nr:retrovirus-related Pol polyprotein from transposon TNT 1-94 [Tanacetum cinerariifolium]
MYDKKNKVLFTYTKCLVLSPDFKLPDENHVLLRVPRQNNMYTFNLENIVPSGDLACLIAKATVDESNKWHRRDIIEFCASKGIKSEYSNARTPQQNRVGERKNRTLIEAARTMLADSFLPNTFWAEVVSTACYVFNRVLVTKPQNKTLYELINGKIPIINYIRPFGYHVTILNTIDHLGKFEEKSDEGFLVGYSLNSKAFRPVTAENKANKTAGPKEANNSVAKNRNEKLIGHTGSKTNEEPVDQEDQAFLEELARLKRHEKEADDAAKTLRKNFAKTIEDLLLQEGAARANSTNNVHTASTPIPSLEDIYEVPNDRIFTSASYDDEGAVADFTNLESTVNVSPIPQSRIHSIHPITQILRDPTLVVQIRSKVNKSLGAYDFVSYIQKQRRRAAAIQLNKFGFWLTCLLGKSKIDGKVYVSQPPAFIDPKFPKKVYKVVKALYGLHQAPRAWYATLSNFLVQSGYRKGLIDKTLFIKKDKKDIMLVQVYVDDIIFGSTKQSWCDEFKTLMKSIFQMSSMGELTFFLRLQVKQKEDEIFISQDKYVADILKKFDFISVKTVKEKQENDKIGSKSDKNGKRGKARQGVKDVSQILAPLPRTIRMITFVGAARQWLEKEPPRSITTWDDLVSKFINEFFPPSRTTNLHNEISNFHQKFDESFLEAWERYKDLLRACPHHGFTELHQLDTLYNALNPAHQDSLNVAAGSNLLEKRPQDALTIIENKSKVRNSQSKLIASPVNACDINSSSEIAKLTHAVNQQTSDVTTAMTAMLKQLQVNPPPAPVKAVEEICVTCGGAHPYYQCLAASGNTFPEFKDNIQGSLPGNTVANPNGELKAITTRSGLVTDGPTVSTPLKSVNPEEHECVEETYTDLDLAQYTIKVPPPPVQKHKPLKMLKALLSNKEKLQELANTPLNKNCSAVILKKLPEKLRDPRKFLVPCGFSELKCKALADLGASINLMPLSVWRKLADFVVVDYESNPRVPLILERPFLRTARALIDVHGEEMILPSYSNHPHRESVNLINIFNVSSEDCLEALVSNPTSGNPTFSLHKEITSLEVTHEIHDSEGCNFLSEELPDIDSFNDIHPHFDDNPLSGSTTYSSNSLLEEFTDELALITYPLDCDDNLQFDIESDLKEIEFLLYHGKDSSLKDSIDQTDLANLDGYFVDPTLEMFDDEHAPDYSSPSRFDVYDDDFLEIESDADNFYDDPFDSKGRKSKNFSRDDDLPSPDNEDNVFNPGILIQEKSVTIITRVAQEKKLAISKASLVFEDFDPPFYEPIVFKDVPKSMMLLPFSSENEEKVFKPGIYSSEKVKEKQEKDKIRSKPDKNGKRGKARQCGNFLDKMPADCLKIIERKSKVHQTRAKAVVAKVNSNSSTPAVSFDVAELKLKGYKRRESIGSLMYLAASRPDIMYAVCAYSRFQVTPKTSHLHAVKRIFRYIKGQPKSGLWYPRDSSFDLEAYSDSDYAGANLDRKSTTGGC